MLRGISEPFLNEEESGPQITSTMREQIDCLSASKRELQARLENERLEYLVDRVEGEVELEGMMEEMCMRLKADDEIMDLERREREWEIERQEVRFEEEIAVLKDTVCRLEEELKVAHAEKEFAIQKKQEEIEKATRRRLNEVCEGNADTSQVKEHTMEQRMQAILKSLNNEELETPVDSPSKTIIVAFEDVLKAADERAENQRRECEEIKQSKEKIEQNFRDEWQRWTSQEKQLKSQVNVLEKEMARLSALIHEKDSLNVLERERRAEFQTDAERALDTFREERKLHSVALGKLQKLENILHAVKEKVSRGQEVLRVHKDHDAGSRLEEIFKDLNEDASRMTLVLSQKKDNDNASTQIKLIEAWKVQRDSAVRERDTLEEKLSLLLRRARDRESEIEAMWSEREKTLLEKVHSVQESSYRWEAKYKKRETELLHERKLWEGELGAMKKDWEDDKAGGEAMTRGQTQWSKSQDQRLTSSVERNMSELPLMTITQKNVAVSSKGCFEDMKNSVVKIKSSSEKDDPFMHDTSRMDGSQDSCTGSSETQESSSKVLLVVQETVNRDNKAESCVNVQKSTLEIEAEVGRLTREVKIKEEKLEKEQREVKLGIELLREERKELERKFSENLLLMEDLKRDIKVKECKMEQERKQLEVVIFQKAAELEQMKAKLVSKEQEIDILQQKFTTEVQMIEEEVEKERKERQQVIDLHFASKKRLIDEMDLKEEKREKEIDRMIQELQKVRRDVSIRDQENQRLGERNLALKNEKNLWEMVAQKQNAQVAYLVFKVIEENEALQQKLKGEENAGTGSLESSARHIEIIGEKHFDNSRKADLVKQVSKWLRVDSCEDEINNDNRDAEWQFAVGKVAVFDKQIGEAMHAIDKLREELRVKETELLKVRTEPEVEWERREAAWSEEQDWQRQAEKERADEWIQKEHQLNMEKDQLLKLLEVERSEAADVIASLHGIIRELKWSLMHYQENGSRDSINDSNKLETFQKLIPNTEIVKVHTSHLEELDHYILDLKTKLEHLEKDLKAAEAALSAQALNNAAREESLDAALMEIEKEVLRISEHTENNLLLPAVNHGVFVPHYQQTEHFAKSEALGYSGRLKLTDPGRTRGTLRSLLRNAFGSVNMIMQEASQGPTKSFYDQGILFWESEVGKGSKLNTNIARNAGLNSVKGATGEEPQTTQDSYCEGQRAFIFPPLPCRQQRWVVDAAWLEHVRKEHASLKHALMVEQQRASSLAQIEEENRFLDALLIRALEQKLDYEQIATKLQDKVFSLETTISKASLRSISS
ncbi:hypothetical protein O6H91_10G064300 [Diphasiastrum complanatum]|uniref:Uncharacterized protein n=12 Tax=Diphasiastrum complanatum TaxID=34168 RepID=A0ACC2CHT7_DIPCM|nr:hypothetical protein O6H91_10G064300 [Diphasiastrum complanatum]KAJ7541538.1 hypothetical protein O6H91_10G064300 [Diphasiastrum complanatum]KAJ7541539.1 hypothetical protein O6H91_10G064300 [Diphasiastrum complanatum]KAJ7541540.1 hypothetical protein O6H91_10G064300 [Diphasiastrum complanatum]KAJ7541541.1 hypothetical protein O6H91_10G064300 [Diphasiastrum complanatum]